MKKRLLLLSIAFILVLTGCQKKNIDVNNLSQNYSSVISIPYGQYINRNIDDVKNELKGMTCEDNKYYIHNSILEFEPYFLVDEKGYIKVAGFETVKKVDDDIVNYINGFYNMLMSYYGDVKIDNSITKRVKSINDISMCKDNEKYKEVWDNGGFPIEYFVEFENGNCNIKIQYNKDVK